MVSRQREREVADRYIDRERERERERERVREIDRQTYILEAGLRGIWLAWKMIEKWF